MKTGVDAILCMDVDGTLIDADEKIHPEDLAWLQEFPSHIQLVLTTGRSLKSAKTVLQQNGLYQGKLFPLPGVFLNGGAAYGPGEVLSCKHHFSQKTRVALNGLASTHSLSAFTFFTLEDVFMANPTPFAKHISKIHHLEAQEANPTQVPDEVIKLMILDQDQTSLAAIKQEIAEWEVEGAFSLPYAFEINPPGITKAKTLQLLLKAFGLQSLPVFTVGDGENDLSLFGLSQMCFAPSSAHPAILEKADQIIKRKKDGLLSPILDQIQKGAAQ